MRKFTKPSDAELRSTLTPEQYRVTQKEGTEPPFRNEYNDNKKPGIYILKMIKNNDFLVRIFRTNNHSTIKSAINKLNKIYDCDEDNIRFLECVGNGEIYRDKINKELKNQKYEGNTIFKLDIDDCEEIIANIIYNKNNDDLTEIKN